MCIEPKDGRAIGVTDLLKHIRTTAVMNMDAPIPAKTRLRPRNHGRVAFNRVEVGIVVGRSKDFLEGSTGAVTCFDEHLSVWKMQGGRH